MVGEGQMWKERCLKEFPELEVFEEVRETDLTRDKGSNLKPSLEREECIYRHLFQELKDEPLIERSCIHEAVSASSTDSAPGNSIVHTLYPEQTLSYWSSTGQEDVNYPETLTYQLVSPLCMVHEVCIQPFRAVFQQGQPVYSARHVQIRFGHARTDCDTANGNDYVWTHESEKFPMEQVDSMQVFKLPRPILCIGGVLQVEFLGRVQIQQLDQLYYICIYHVSVVGRPLSDFKAHLPRDQSKFWLEYIATYKGNETGGDGAHKSGVTDTKVIDDNKAFEELEDVVVDDSHSETVEEYEKSEEKEVIRAHKSGVLDARKVIDNNQAFGELKDMVLEGSHIEKVEEDEKSEERKLIRAHKSGVLDDTDNQAFDKLEDIVVEDSHSEMSEEDEKSEESEVIRANKSGVLDACNDTDNKGFGELEDMVVEGSHIEEVEEDEESEGREVIQAPDELMKMVVKLEAIPEETSSRTSDYTLETEIVPAEDSTQSGSGESTPHGSSSQSIIVRSHSTGMKNNENSVDNAFLDFLEKRVEDVNSRFPNIENIEKTNEDRKREFHRAKENFMKDLEEEKENRLLLRDHLLNLEAKIKFNHHQCNHLIKSYVQCEVLFADPKEYADIPVNGPLYEKNLQQLKPAFVELRRIMEHGVYLVEECTKEHWIQSLALSMTTLRRVYESQFKHPQWEVVTSFSLNLQEFQWILGVVRNMIANLWSLTKRICDDKQLAEYFQFQRFNLKQLEGSQSEMEAMDQESLMKSLLEYIKSHEENHELASYILKKLQGQDQTESIDISHATVKDEIGEGGLAKVYKWKWKGLEVALKAFLIGDESNRGASVTLGQAEGEFSKLQHPHIVRVLGHGCGKLSYNILMERMDKDLYSLVRDPDTKLQDTINLMLQIAKAMKHLNDCLVMHRDLKSKNVLVNPCKCIGHEGCFILKLSDFGESKYKTRADTKFTTQNKGTKFWMAPEVMKGDTGTKKYTIAADIFSFAITCAELLIRGGPYSKEIMESSYRHRKRVIAGVRPELPDNCPPLLIKYLERCWDTTAEKRPQQFAEICEFLQYLKELQLWDEAQMNLSSIIEYSARMRVTHLGLEYCLEKNSYGSWRHITDEMYEHVVMEATYLNKWKDLSISERKKQMIQAADYFGDWTASLERDYKKAVQILQSSGCAEANWRLGYCYELGLGVEQSMEEAFKFYMEAIALDSNFGRAHVELGRWYAMKKDYDNASKCWTTAFSLSSHEGEKSPFKSIEEQITRLTKMSKGQRKEVALRLHAMTVPEVGVMILKAANNSSLIEKLLLEEQLSPSALGLGMTNFNRSLIEKLLPEEQDASNPSVIHHSPIDKLKYINPPYLKAQGKSESIPPSKADLEKANMKEGDSRKLQKEEDDIIRRICEAMDRSISPLPETKFVPPQERTRAHDKFLYQCLLVACALKALVSCSRNGQVGYFFTCIRLLTLGLLISPWGLSYSKYKVPRLSPKWNIFFTEAGGDGASSHENQKTEEMKPPAKKITRVFVARIPPSVTDEVFRSYFEKYGTLTDAYMPKDQGSKAHRGIGFVTFENPESVDRLMNETHELGGSTIAVDRATPKEDGNKTWGRGFHGGNSNSGSNAGSGAYGPYGVYTAARFGGFGGGFGAYDYSGSGLGSDLGPSGGLSGAYGGGNSWPPAPPGGGYGGPGLGIPGGGSGSYGSGGPPVPPLRGLGTKIFVGRLPPEANAEDLRRYFNNFGRISDVYVPKDAKKTSHRGFGFVTFSDEGAAERVALRSHEILGHQIAVDRAAPQDEMSNMSYMNSVGALGSLSQGAGGPMRGSNAPLQGSGYGSLSGNLDFSSGWGGYGGVGGLPSGLDSGLQGGHRSSRSEPRYRPY